jgi:4-oxalocrotonate tautomerase family enzyme
MPIVTIETWPIPQERKPELMKKITKVFTEYGIPAQAVTILIHETQMDNWGTAGEQHSKTYKDIKRENMKL